MPKYKVTMRRTFEEFGEIEVEVKDDEQAKEDAVNLTDEMAWSEQSLDEETIESCEGLS